MVCFISFFLCLIPSFPRLSFHMHVQLGRGEPWVSVEWGQFIYFSWRHCFKVVGGQGPPWGLIGWDQGTTTKVRKFVSFIIPSVDSGGPMQGGEQTRKLETKMP